MIVCFKNTQFNCLIEHSVLQLKSTIFRGESLSSLRRNLQSDDDFFSLYMHAILFVLCSILIVTKKLPGKKPKTDFEFC